MNKKIVASVLAAAIVFGNAPTSVAEVVKDTVSNAKVQAFAEENTDFDVTKLNLTKNISLNFMYDVKYDKDTDKIRCVVNDVHVLADPTKYGPNNASLTFDVTEVKQALRDSLLGNVYPDVDMDIVDDYRGVGEHDTFAGKEIEYVLGNGSGLIDSFSNIANVTIKGFDAIGKSAFSGSATSSHLQWIEFDERVRTIESSAFSGCSILTGTGQVNPNAILDLTNVEVIDDSAFSGCKTIKQVKLNFGGNGTKGLLRIGNSAFSSCSSIMEMNIPNTINNSIAEDNLNDLKAAEYGYSIKEIIEQKMRSSKKPQLGNSAFSGCTSLSSVNFQQRGSDQGYQLYIGSGVFNGCTSLTKITEGNDERNKLPSYTATVQSGVFTGCNSLASFAIDSNLGCVPENTFSNCKQLNTVTFINYNGQMEVIGSSAFTGCEALKDITLPDSITGIGSNSFSGCTSLNKINLPNSLYLLDGGAFSGCTNLAGDYTIPDSCVLIGEYAFQNCKSITGINFNLETTQMSGTGEEYKGIDGKIYADDGIYKGAFKGCVKLKSFTFPDAIITIQEELFDGCTDLKNVTYPKTTDMAIKFKKNTFRNCASLRSIQPSDKPVKDGVLQIGSNVNTIENSVFEGCQSAEYVQFLLKDGKNESECAEIGQAAFKNCSLLEGSMVGDTSANGILNIPSKITVINSEVFAGCESLEKVHVDGNITALNDSAFKDCKKMEECTFTSSVPTIGSGVFQGCESLLHMPSFMSGKDNISIYENPNVDEIKSSSFSGCKALADIVIPANIVKLGSGAFSRCESAKSVKVLGNSKLQSINSGVFNGCTALETFTFEGDSVLTAINSNAFSSCENFRQFVCKSADAYKSESNQDRKNTFSYLPDTLLTIETGAFNKTAIKGVVSGNSLTDLKISAFSGCPELTWADFTRSKNLGGIGDEAFNGCQKLETARFDENIKTIGKKAFYDCRALSSFNSNAGSHIFNIPKNITLVDDQTFYNNLQMETINIPASVITLANSAFNINYVIPAEEEGKYHLLKAINIDKDNQYYSSVDGILFNKAQNTLINYPMAKEGKEYTVPESVTLIGEYAFASNKNIEKASMPNKLEGMGRYCFNKCDNLKEVWFNNLSTTEIGDYAITNTRTDKEDVIIYGISGSSAETYAKKTSKVSFIDINTGANTLAIKQGTKASFARNQKDVKLDIIGYNVKGEEVKDFEYSWVSGDSSKVTVDKDGNLTLRAETKDTPVVITAKTPTGVTATIEITVTSEKSSVADSSSRFEDSSSVNSSTTDSSSRFEDSSYNDSSSNSEGKFEVGDVDRNGKVDTADALLVLKKVVGLETLDAEQTALADTDKNGSVDTTDALNILKKVVGLI